MKPASLLIFLALVFACFSCGQTSLPSNKPTTEPLAELVTPPQPVGQYVVALHEDRTGDIWIGTLGEGLARYDGKSLVYLTTEDGLVSNHIVEILEDKEGLLWIGTQNGLSVYDGAEFTNYNEEDGLIDNRISNMLFDSNGNLWIGTWSGVCRFNGGAFTEFSLPNPAVPYHDYQTTMDWITILEEDASGNLWFGRDGYGVAKYDGQSFTHYTTADGLHSNNVTSMVQDRDGSYWIGTRIAERDHPDAGLRYGPGGLNRMMGGEVISFPETPGLIRNDVYFLGQDPAGNLWIPARDHGIYRYDGSTFTLFNQTDVEVKNATLMVQSMLVDSKGRYWFGVSGGLYRLEGETLVYVGRTRGWG